MNHREESPPFQSILFERPVSGFGQKEEEPAFFRDLNLDQVIGALNLGREEYGLKPFFNVSLDTIDAIAYRHEVFRDLENDHLRKGVSGFASEMALVRKGLVQAEKSYYKQEKEAIFLEAAGFYCEAIDRFARVLSEAEIISRGFTAFRSYMKAYVGSPAFKILVQQTHELKKDLTSVRYCLLIKSDLVNVRKYEQQADYSEVIESTFRKFQQGAAKDYRIAFPESGMNHIEAKILEFVAQLYPEIFSALERFCAEHRDFRDAFIVGFDREIQFYIGYIDYAEKLKRGGLSFCYPEVVNERKDIYVREAFDVALASKLMADRAPIVANDFYLHGQERVIVVSGPNQGGKTTFARMFGQLHFLASLGCPVPGREARLFLFDRVFTHFEKEETIKDLRGKLQDELIRIHEILDQATTSSILIVNEIFASTTLQDAVFLGREIIKRIIAKDILCVCVTFLDELASVGVQTVSMVSTIVPENPAQRTFKIVRKPADGLAYAMAIAEKYALTYVRLKERVRR